MATKSLKTLNHVFLQKKSERPVDALAVKKYQSFTHSLTDNFKSRDASASKNFSRIQGPEIENLRFNIENAGSTMRQPGSVLVSNLLVGLGLPKMLLLGWSSSRFTPKNAIFVRLSHFI